MIELIDPVSSPSVDISDEVLSAMSSGKPDVPEGFHTIKWWMEKTGNQSYNSAKEKLKVLVSKKKMESGRFFGTDSVGRRVLMTFYRQL